jgi:hypothetical protein
VGYGVLGTGEVHPSGVAAGADDELLTGDPGAVAERERVRIHEPGIAGSVHDARARRFELFSELLLLLDLVDDALRPVQEAGEIHLGRVAGEPVAGELLRVAHQAGGFGEDAGRDAAVVGAGPAHVAAFDQRDRGAQLAGAQGRRHARRSTPDHDYLKHRSPGLRPARVVQAA